MKRLTSNLLAVILLYGLLNGSIVRGQDSNFLPAVFEQSDERAALVAKNDEARTKVEAMINRLKALEQV